MEAQKDFRELFALFNAHKVDYTIAGAYALAFHGAPRYTVILISLSAQMTQTLKIFLTRFVNSALNRSA